MNLRTINLTKESSEDLQENIFSQLESSHNAAFTQAPWYSEWHANAGRNVFQLAVVDDSNNLYAYVQLIQFKMPFGQSYFYAPYGPVILTEEHGALQTLVTAIKNLQKENGVTFTRFDITPTTHNEKLKKLGLKPVPKCATKGSITQPRNEWVIDLQPTEDELHNNIHKKTRYDIRQAEKNGVEIIIADNEVRAFTKTFYTLLKETADRNNFYLHSEEYYKDVFETVDREGIGYLIIGMKDDAILTMHLIVTYSDTAMYIFGGTRNENRNIPSSHLVEWHSILFAKKRGLTKYNMGGISTQDDPDPKLDHVTRFKRRFGGSELTHAQLHDLIQKPIWYHLYILRKWITSRNK